MLGFVFDFSDEFEMGGVVFLVFLSLFLFDEEFLRGQGPIEFFFVVEPEEAGVELVEFQSHYPILFPFQIV